jgi:hypothetical protein
MLLELGIDSFHARRLPTSWPLKRSGYFQSLQPCWLNMHITHCLCRVVNLWFPITTHGRQNSESVHWVSEKLKNHQVVHDSLHQSMSAAKVCMEAALLIFPSSLSWIVAHGRPTKEVFWHDKWRVFYRFQHASPGDKPRLWRRSCLFASCNLLLVSGQ